MSLSGQALPGTLHMSCQVSSRGCKSSEFQDLILPLVDSGGVCSGFGLGDVLGTEKEGSAGETASLHPPIHPPSCCLSEYLLSNFCAPGPEQGAENIMGKTVDTIPAFTQFTVGCGC